MADNTVNDITGAMAEGGPIKDEAEKTPQESASTPAPAPVQAPASTPASISSSSPGPGPGPGSASASSVPPTRPFYVPQFTAATQMILKRMKGEPSSLSAALSQASRSPSATPSIASATYEDVKKRLVMGMNTSTQMTMQMPAAPPPTRPLPPTLPALAPVSASKPPPAPASIVAKPTSSTAGMSAIRKVTAGLTASSKPTPIKTTAVKVLLSESKTKKTKPPTPLPRSSTVKRKRTKSQANQDDDEDEDETSSISSLSSLSEPSTTAAVALESTALSTPVPLTMTKSGRQVLKPTAYNPAAMDAASKRPRAPAHHYGKRTTEQALCKKCSRMHSPATNQMVFCDGCNEGWHQLCHDPWIGDDVVRDQSKAWLCAPCVEKRERHHHHHPHKRQKVEQNSHHHPHQHPNQHGPKHKGAERREKESWASRPAQQKRAYLSTLPQQELVALLMACLETQPDLPIFPASSSSSSAEQHHSSATTSSSTTGSGPRSIFAGTTTEGLFPRADAHPTAQINFVRKVSAASVSGTSGKGETRGSGGQNQKEDSLERAATNELDDEFDPLVALWPRAGRGMYTRLPPDTEDEARLVDEGDFEAFSVIVYDDRGRKMEENGMKV